MLVLLLLETLTAVLTSSNVPDQQALQPALLASSSSFAVNCTLVLVAHDADLGTANASGHIDSMVNRPGCNPPRQCTSRPVLLSSFAPSPFSVAHTLVPSHGSA